MSGSKWLVGAIRNLNIVTMPSPPEHYLIAHSDGGARGNPGPAGYGVVIKDNTAGKKVAGLANISAIRPIILRNIRG